MMSNSSREWTQTSVKQPGKKAKNRGPKTTLWFLALLILTVLSGLIGGSPSPVAAQTPSKTSFTYQGQLLNNGSRITASCSFQFTLYDAATAGNIVGATQTVDNVTVKNSYFTTQLDFGLSPFGDTVNYLALAVKCSPDTTFTEMTTRVPLTPAPTALVAQKALALPWSGLSSVPSPLTFLSNPTPCTNGQVAKWNSITWECAADADTNYAAGAGLTLASGAFGVSFAGSGSASTAARSDHTHAALTAVDGVPIGASNPSTGKFTTLEAASLNITGGAGTGKVLTSDASGAATWQTPASWGLTGNAGTTAGNFIGTTDAQALEFKVNGTRALRLEPNTTSPNVIGGYSGNNVTSGVKGATIAGGGLSGSLNSVTDDYGTVSGGEKNQAGDNSGATNDKKFATVGGGKGNTASGYSATVSGGFDNIASGDDATVGGGTTNTAAGDYSFAAGNRAKVAATHKGTFLWADKTSADFASAAANEFAVRATGGVRFVTAVDGSGNPTAGATLSTGGGGWSTTSDRNAKANFVPVASQDVLSKVAALPLSTWNYKTQDAKIRHMGPMAQDLYQAFGLGEDDKHISTIDADGVALAAIQGLAQQTKTQQAQIETQKAQLEAQQAEITLLKERLTTLEALLKQK